MQANGCRNHEVSLSVGINCIRFHNKSFCSAKAEIRQGVASENFGTISTVIDKYNGVGRVLQVFPSRVKLCISSQLLCVCMWYCRGKSETQN